VNTDVLMDTLKSDEGFSAFPYHDSQPEKYLTIGYGFLVDARKGVGLPRPVAEFWLRYAVNERLEELQRLWPAFKDQPADVQNALGNLAYQIGPAGVMGFKRMLAALQAGDRVTAAEELLDSKLAKQTPARTERTARLLRG
jgi:lysozyme